MCIPTRRRAKHYCSDEKRRNNVEKKREEETIIVQRSCAFPSSTFYHSRDVRQLHASRVQRGPQKPQPEPLTC
jgi:hypothetical protein